MYKLASSRIYFFIATSIFMFCSTNSLRNPIFPMNFLSCYLNLSSFNCCSSCEFPSVSHSQIFCSTFIYEWMVSIFTDWYAPPTAWWAGRNSGGIITWHHLNLSHGLHLKQVGSDDTRRPIPVWQFRNVYFKLMWQRKYCKENQA